MLIKLITINYKGRVTHYKEIKTKQRARAKIASEHNKMINSTRTSESTQTLPTPKKRTRRPAKLSLNLEFPDNQGVFYFYKEQDEDEGSVYYPASLFYKLYKKREKLGEGAAGIVRRYEKRSTKASVAVKVTRTRDDEIFSQIKEEFKKMRQLKHRGVVRYEEMYYDELRGKVFCVMELFEGREMKQVIEHRGPFSGKFV